MCSCVATILGHEVLTGRFSCMNVNEISAGIAQNVARQIEEIRASTTVVSTPSTAVVTKSFSLPAQARQRMKELLAERHAAACGDALNRTE